jgi:hypothetical protein
MVEEGLMIGYILCAEKPLSTSYAKKFNRTIYNVDDFCKVFVPVCEV